MKSVMKTERIQSGVQKSQAAVLGFMTAVYCYAVTAMPAVFANSQSIINGVTKGTGEIWKILTSIVAPIAAVALAICAIKMLWGSQRAAEEAKSTAIKIVVAIAIVLLAPAIIGAVKGWFNAATWSFK